MTDIERARLKRRGVPVHFGFGVTDCGLQCVGVEWTTDAAEVTCGECIEARRQLRAIEDRYRRQP